MQPIERRKRSSTICARPGRMPRPILVDQALNEFRRGVACPSCWRLRGVWPRVADGEARQATLMGNHPESNFRTNSPPQDHPQLEHQNPQPNLAMAIFFANQFFLDVYSARANLLAGTGMKD